MATEASICNMALGHIGCAPVIVNLETDRNPEAVACRLYFDHCIETLLQAANWGFARTRAQLQLSDAAVPDGWTYAYRYPNDCKFFRAIVNPGSRQETAESKIPFVIFEESSVGGKLIATDQEQAVGEYTRETSITSMLPPDFVEAVTWALAARICGPLKVDAKVKQFTAQNASLWLAQAAARNNAEQREDLMPDSEFVTGRY